MNTKLTLTLEKSTIEKAKRFAKQSGRSLSDLVESYLEKLVKTGDKQEELPDEFKDLFDSISLPSDVSDKQLIRQILSYKHKT